MSFGPPPSVYTQSSLAEETRRKKRRRTRLLASAAVALAAALGVGGWLVWTRDGGSTTSGKPAAAPQGPLDIRETVERKPAGTTGAMAFRFSVDDMSAGEHYEMPGMWATDKILAKGINQTLVGYPIGSDAAPGKNDERWKLRLDGPICGYTPHVTGDNRTAVLFKANDRKDAYCNHVAFFDLDDGKEVWEETFPVSTAGSSVSSPQRTPAVTLTHGTVVVTWGGGTSAFDMDRGTTRWRTTVSGSCRDEGAAGGRGLLIRQVCWTEGRPAGDWDGTTYAVRRVDLATGRTSWTYTAARGVRELAVPSAEPPVLAVSAGETGITELLSLDGKGHHRATISLQNGTYVGECTSGDYIVADDCPTIAVGDGQVFVRSKDQQEKGHNSNWIIGFDLTTGTSTTKFDSGPDALLRPIRMSGDRLLALRTSEDKITPTAVVSLDPATGTETPYLYFNLPQEAETFTLTDSHDILVQNGRVFFGAKAADGPPGRTKQWIWLVLGIQAMPAGKH